MFKRCLEKIQIELRIEIVQNSKVYQKKRKKAPALISDLIKLKYNNGP